jgi:hypothetical protein
MPCCAPEPPVPRAPMVPGPPEPPICVTPPCPLSVPALPPLPPLPPHVHVVSARAPSCPLALFPLAAVPLHVFVPFVPFVPGTDAEPAVIAHRRNVTFCDAFTSTAWLEPPAVVAGTESNSKSSNVTPFVSPFTCSANPGAVGVSFVVVPAVYVHVAQSNPPYTEVPSRVVPETTSCSAVNVPHAYTREPVSIACPIEP